MSSSSNSCLESRYNQVDTLMTHQVFENGAPITKSGRKPSHWRNKYFNNPVMVSWFHTERLTGMQADCGQQRFHRMVCSHQCLHSCIVQDTFARLCLLHISRIQLLLYSSDASWFWSCCTLPFIEAKAQQHDDDKDTLRWIVRTCFNDYQGMTITYNAHICIQYTPGHKNHIKERPLDMQKYYNGVKCLHSVVSRHDRHLK